jgi:hypothetical protein
MYYSRINGFDTLIFGKKEGYAASDTQPKLMPLGEELVQN